MTIEIKIREFELKYKDEFSSLTANTVENLIKLINEVTQMTVVI